jgi:hypothetical protein
MLVLIEMPWEALSPTERRTYLKACIRDALFREETPLSRPAMLSWTEALYDNDIDQQVESRKVHKKMVEAAGLVAFYEDQGWSKSMVKATEWAHTAGTKVVRRKIYTGGF